MTVVAMISCFLPFKWFGVFELSYYVAVYVGCEFVVALGFLIRTIPLLAGILSLQETIGRINKNSLFIIFCLFDK